MNNETYHQLKIRGLKPLPNKLLRRLAIPLALLTVLLILRFQQWYWWHWSFMVKTHTVIESYDKGGNNEIERD